MSWKRRRPGGRLRKELVVGGTLVWVFEKSISQTLCVYLFS